MGPPLPTESGFDDFYRHHRAPLVATLRAAARCDAESATDAVDEAFVRALAQWSRVERMEAPAGWVFTVARNHLRRSRSRRRTESDLVGRPGSWTVAGGRAAAADGDWELWAAVAELPERERTAIALRYLADLTEREVATAMGIAPGTVAATLHNARRHLAEHLADRPETGPETAPVDAGGAER